MNESRESASREQSRVPAWSRTTPYSSLPLQETSSLRLTQAKERQHSRQRGGKGSTATEAAPDALEPRASNVDVVVVVVGQVHYSSRPS